MRTFLIPLIAVFAGGLAYSLIPRGAFGAYRVVGDAAVVALAAFLMGFLLVGLNKRRGALGRGA